MLSARAEVLVCLNVALCACLGACSDPPAERVAYTSGKPLGDWYESEHGGPTTPAADGGESARPPVSGSSVEAGSSAPAPRAGGSAAGKSGANSATAGTAASVATPAGSSAVAGQSGMNTAGPGGNTAPVPAESGIRVRFSALTQVQHMGVAGFDLNTCAPSKDAPAPAGEGQYARGPCNVGAIWITTDTGAFVTVLALWAKLEVDNLVDYTAQYAAVRKALDVTTRTELRNYVACHVQKTTSQDCADALAVQPADAPDVTATATLHAHQMHTVTWNHTNWQQQAVPPGRYQLHVEVSDYDLKDATARALTQNPHNAALTIALDTAACPAMVTAPSAMYFESVSVECQSQ